MPEKQEILDYLSSNKDLFHDKFDVIKIGLFGSYARNEQNKNSDIDIIIEMPRGIDNIFEKKIELREMLKREFNKDIDLCRERSIKPLFRDLVLKDVIYV